MSNNSKSVPAVSSVERAGRVVDGGDVSSEGLGLGGGPVLTLERLGHALVGHLASSTVDRGGVDSSVDHRSGNGVSSVDNRGGVDDRAGNSVGNRVGKSMTNNTVGKSVTDNSVGNASNNSSLSKVASEARLGSVAHRVGGSDGGDGGTEALGLAGSPDLTLEGLGH